MDCPSDASGFSRNPRSATSQGQDFDVKITADSNVPATASGWSSASHHEHNAQAVEECLRYFRGVCRALEIAGATAVQLSGLEIGRKTVEALLVGTFDTDNAWLVEEIPSALDRRSYVLNVQGLLGEPLSEDFDVEMLAQSLLHTIKLLAPRASRARACSTSAAPRPSLFDCEDAYHQTALAVDGVRLKPPPPTTPAVASVPANLRVPDWVPYVEGCDAQSTAAAAADPLQFAPYTSRAEPQQSANSIPVDQLSQLIAAIGSATSNPSAAGATSVIAQAAEDVRKRLTDLCPGWYVEPSATYSSIGAIGLTPWEHVVIGAPASKHDPQTHIQVPALKQLLTSSASTSTGRATGGWTTCRTTFLSSLGQLYVYSCIMSTASNCVFSDAVRAASSRTHEHAVSAAVFLPSLKSAVIASRRMLLRTSAEAALIDLLQAFDDVLMPSRQDTHSRWQTLAVKEGESGGEFINRVFELAAEFDKTDRETLLQIETCIQTATAGRADTTVAILCGAVLSSTSTMQGLLAECKRQRSLFDKPLISPAVPPLASPATPTLQTGLATSSLPPPSPLTLATGDTRKPLRQAYDHANAAKHVALHMNIKAPTDMPPGPWKNCVFCQVILGYTLSPYDEAKPGRPPPGTVYEHHSWRCPRAETAALKFCAKYGVAKEDFLKPLDTVNEQVCAACVAAAAA